MAEIQLTRGQVALVDDADLPLLSGYTWYALRGRHGNTWYAAACKPHSDGCVLMHRLLLPGVAQIDHRDLNGLNNQRANLRPCTSSQNMMNRGKRCRGTSRYKGVYWDRRQKRWTASIRRDGHLRHLGRFLSEAEAARAYNAAALETFGEFARLNVIEEPANA